ncbi:MAG: elongation factor G [Alphaproteobacteria bacterium]|nr:elongation factor G [Alphaproteobacteria bacterium]
MSTRHSEGGQGPRIVALVGPYASGKTLLLESLLAATGAISRKGAVAQGNTLGDSSAEARAHQMSVEPNVASIEYLGDRFTIIDCPGSVEFQQEALNALPVVDMAVVVAEPDGAKAAMLQPILKLLGDLSIPHLIFINKLDKAQGRVRDLLTALQAVSPKPLVLRQIPIWTDGAVTGVVDLALERGYHWQPHAEASVTDIPGTLAEREREARFQMLERLADFDDHLMEELLSDVEPPRDEVFADLTRELREGHIVPVLLGSAEGDNGVRRLLKALRHEAPSVAETAARLGLAADAPSALHVFKTLYGTGGKLSLARVLAGSIKDGATLTRSDGSSVRVGGLFTLMGAKTSKITEAGIGEIVALGRLDPVETGEALTTERVGLSKLAPRAAVPPVFGLAILAKDRKDEVKLTGAIAKLREEDPSLDLTHNPETHEMVLLGQGEIHLRVAVERLQSKYGLTVETSVPRVPYQETIRKTVTQRGRHKRQTGGHGQFGDVVVEIKPLPRGSGFVFSDRITGGVVPKQWIPSVEKGVRDALSHGPLGFPVVDLSVTLTDGSYHSVDSSDGAFQTAGRIAMSEGLPAAVPVLLEPIMAVSIHVPSDATARVNAMVSSRRGQILGFDARAEWPGWDTVSAHLPAAELHDLIVDLRSATQGTGTYVAHFDHMAELTGKLADHVLATARAA